MANVIIGIHGLGNKPPKAVLERRWRLAMTEGLKLKKINSILPKFELVYWADIIHKEALSEAEKDIDDSSFLHQATKETNGGFSAESHSLRRKFVDFISRQLNRILLNEDYSLKYSFITDAVVSKYFKDLEIYYTESHPTEDKSVFKAKDLINERLIKVLEKYKSDQIMLISHSMGSIIAFDVLNSLKPDIRIDTLATIGSPLGLPLVISKIAAQQKKSDGRSHVTTPSPIIKNWYNFSDIDDKIALNYKLADDFSENEHGVRPMDFLVENNFELNGKRNPHEAFGYLITPEFSQVLNSFILSERLSIKEKVIRKTTQIIHILKEQFSFWKEERKAGITKA